MIFFFIIKDAEMALKRDIQANFGIQVVSSINQFMHEKKEMRNKSWSGIQMTM